MDAFPQHERRRVRPPVQLLAQLDWEDLDFLSWVHISGHLGFIVMADGHRAAQGIDGGMARGMVLQRRMIDTSGARRFMCDVCCTIHGQRGVASFTRWNRDRTVARTVTLCANLKCGFYLRGKYKVDDPQMSETIPRDDKIDRMMANLRRYTVKLSFQDG